MRGLVGQIEFSRYFPHLTSFSSQASDVFSFLVSLYLSLQIYRSAKMSPSNNILQNGENEENGRVFPGPGKWTSIWQNNRGMLMILLSEVAGSSMDAIVRFLQQGEHRIHPFQVSISPLPSPQKKTYSNNQ